MDFLTFTYFKVTFIGKGRDMTQSDAKLRGLTREIIEVSRNRYYILGNQLKSDNFDTSKQ